MEHECGSTDEDEGAHVEEAVAPVHEGVAVTQVVALERLVRHATIVPNCGAENVVPADTDSRGVSAGALLTALWLWLVAVAVVLAHSHLHLHGKPHREEEHGNGNCECQ